MNPDRAKSFGLTLAVGGNSLNVSRRFFSYRRKLGFPSSWAGSVVGASFWGDGIPPLWERGKLATAGWGPVNQSNTCHFKSSWEIMFTDLPLYVRTGQIWLIHNFHLNIASFIGNGFKVQCIKDQNKYDAQNFDFYMNTFKYDINMYIKVSISYASSDFLKSFFLLKWV